MTVDSSRRDYTPSGNYYVHAILPLQHAHQACVYYEQDTEGAWHSMGSPVVIKCPAGTATICTTEPSGLLPVNSDLIALVGVTACTKGNAGNGALAPFYAFDSGANSVQVESSGTTQNRAAALIFAISDHTGVTRIACSLDPEIQNGVGEPPPHP